MNLIVVILLIPLIGFVLLFTLRKWRDVTIPAILLSVVLLCLSVVLLIQSIDKKGDLNFYWFSLTDEITFQFQLVSDRMASVMISLVAFISLLVHIFSVEYMRDDLRKGTYFSYLSLFIFSMFGIVFSNNLILTFIFWELVGFSSYLLIGFWRQKESATISSMKAFLVNRIGDLGFLLGILIFWSVFGTLEISVLVKKLASGVPDDQLLILMLAGFGIFCGAMGKSAQFPLQVWLPDAMEGPTPVSALIHAATMVAAGIYLTVKTIGLIHFEVLSIIAVIGAITAFMSAIAAMNQSDIKKVLAYSTVSQLGYMTLGVGVGAYEYAFFHLLTHAFFKAGLFLCSGSVIHALHQADQDHIQNFDPQDMKNMGGLKKKLPITFWAYLIPMLSLSGLPLLSGFLSKDGILSGAMGWATLHQGMFYVVPALGMVTAILTPYYMGRQLILVFLGRSRTPVSIKDRIHENNLNVTIPVVILALLSFWFVFSLNPLDGGHSWVFEMVSNVVLFNQGGAYNPETLQASLYERSHVWHLPISVLSPILALLGFYLAYRKFCNMTAGTDFLLTGTFQRLSYNNWYLDKIYETTFIRLFMATSRGAKAMDVRVIDRLVNAIGIFHVVIAHVFVLFDKYIVDGLVNFAASLSQWIGVRVRRIQTGKIQSQLVWLMLLLLVILYWMVK